MLVFAAAGEFPQHVSIDSWCQNQAFYILHFEVDSGQGMLLEAGLLVTVSLILLET